MRDRGSLCYVGMTSGGIRDERLSKGFAHRFRPTYPGFPVEVVGGKACGIPHLAKNERDVGAPGDSGGDRGKSVFLPDSLAERNTHLILASYIHCTYSHYAYSMTLMADDIKALLPLQPTTFHILLSLTDEDRHGYAIILEVSRRTQGELKLSAGTLYRSIQRMVELGLITETQTRPAIELDDERRRYYRITPLGRAVAEAEAGRLRDLLKMARTCGVAPRTT
jgi:DNA-binding PadR family transcriptional regulator